MFFSKRAPERFKTFPLPFSVADLFVLSFFVIGSLFFLALPAHASDLSIMPKLLGESTVDLSAFGGSPDLIFGLFIGVMLTASLYLFFIWAIVRDKGQVFLMMLLVCLAANMACTNDSMAHVLGLYVPAMRNLLQTYSMVLAYFFSLFFTYYFLDIDLSAPRMKLPLFLMAGLLMLILVATAVDQEMIHFVLPTLGVLAISIVLMAGLASIKAGTSGSISHIIAFMVLLVGSLAVPAHELGYIVYPDTAKNYTYVGFSISAMMFAIVIAGQFASRQEEKERELEVSNERFSLAARGSSEGLFDWDRVAGTLFTSEQLRRIVGISSQKTPKGFREWLSRVHPPDRPIVLNAIRKVRLASGMATINFEYRILHAKGERHWVHTKMVAVKNHATGKIIRLVGSIGDITQRKRSEYELRASEVRFRSITEAHPVPVLIAGLESNEILYASPGAETLLGMPCGVITSNKLDRFLTRSNERDEIRCDILQGNNVDMKEVTVARGDAEPLPAALSARRITYRNEAAMVIGLYDLTERKKAEQQIAQQQEALQQSEKMAALGGLLAGVAHELNNPLSVVMGQTTLLIEGDGEPKVKTRAEKIFKAADRCSRIVKSFLALARRKPPEHKDVNVNTVISNSLDLLGYQFRNENVTVTLELEPDLPTIIGDDDQLTQVFANMALNAAQAMHGWEKERKIMIKTELLQHETILISVVDTGPGIPAEIKRKVFEPFFTTKGGTGGTGVGLALCINIIGGHGGTIVLEDTPGGGATFYITLPVSPRTHTTSSQSASSETQGKGPDRKLRILLVDDEVELAQTLADLLEPGGHDIDLAANGAIALDKLRKKQFDVIISDLRMPVLDGPGLYAGLEKELPQYVKKIIYVTGDTLSPHVNSFLSQTPVPVIEKPYRLADVQAALTALLKEDETQSIIGKNDSA